MKFPSELEFLDAFGIEPCEVDQAMAYCRYSRQSNDGLIELEFSFSGVSRSFQVTVKVFGKELILISSEGVVQIDIRPTIHGSGIHVLFETRDGASEAEVTLEPILHCSWWNLRN